MTHHQEVDRASQGNKLRLDVRMPRIATSRTVESARLRASTIKQYRPIFRKVFALKIAQFDLQLIIENQVLRLDVAVKDASRMNVGDSLSGLLTPRQTLLYRRRGGRVS